MTTVEDYLARFPDIQGARLTELRSLITTSLPDAAEEIKWGCPAYTGRRLLASFAGFPHHLSLYLTPSTLAAFDDDLKAFATGSSGVRLPYDRPLPTGLLRELLAFRSQEVAQGVRWM